ncbi:tRNA (guanosine(46)-N7)-methyltransferase TrmB [Teredinibacter haidensis]|uniref:tRNA (guanosine(46)-N7)-methyltransferase TrmB n=1 Tax=Teredinibacter haidensis TaxID=2731755 RepID=UPI0009491462|nr:tRNA (guanosine(46)-N7)-methyltransferase TrmB [Teredinibacter haidensis]
MKPEYKKKTIRSYVIRGGRMTDGQKNAFDQWWPVYGLSLFDGEISPAEIFEREAPLVVEVGFGMGDSLHEMAAADPDKDFIGIEVHPPGVGRLISLAGASGLSNLRVFMADAVDVMSDCIPESSVDRFQLFFPDPWHKKKHNKRRIVQPAFLQQVRRILKADARFHMATDWENYAEYAMDVLLSAPGYDNTSGESCFAERPAYRPKTKFEARGERLGHGVWDIVFSKVNEC